MIDNMPRGHPFAPLTFYDAAGENPIDTDWCGHLHSQEEVCGLLATAEVHRCDDPDEAIGPSPQINVEAALATHSWQLDEGSSGLTYWYCRRCGRYKADCEPNDFHGPIPCDDGAWRSR